MAWSKNDKPQNRLPDLPPLSLPSPLETRDEQKASEEKIPSLPKFPTSAMGEKMSRETVKSIIQMPEESDDKWKGMSSYNNNEMSVRAQEMNDSKNMVPETDRDNNFMSEKPSRNISGNAQVFIQIDKYQNVLKDLEDAINKVDQVREILKDVKQQKEEEENEITGWENEIAKIKEGLNRIDQTIFKELK